jgi:hypothetical protein
MPNVNSAPLSGQVPRNAYMAGKLFQRSKFLTGASTTYWYTGQAANGIPTRLNNIVHPTPAYVPPTAWPQAGTILHMPKWINWLLVMPSSASARVTAWTAAIAQVMAQVGAKTGVRDLGYAIRSTGSVGGGWINAIAPPGSSNGGTAYLDVAGVLHGDSAAPFLGTDVLNVVVYQGLGLVGDYGVPNAAPFTGLKSYLDVNGVAYIPPLTVGGVNLPVPLGYATAAYGATRLASSESYFRAAWPYFVRNGTLVYYDATPPTAAEAFQYVEAMTANSSNGSPYPTAPATCYVNNDAADDPNPTRLIASDGTHPAMLLTITNQNVWGAVDSFQQSLLRRVCNDLVDLGWQYQGTVTTGKGSFAADILAHYGIQP